MNNSTKKNISLPPQYFVNFVQILFGVVLGSSILVFRDTLFALDFKNPSFWALISVYITASTSWMGWHQSNVKYPYSESKSGYLRSVLDALIVATYAALLYFGNTVNKSFPANNPIVEPNNSLFMYLLGFILVFVLYYFSGLVRKAEYGETASKSRLILGHGAFMLAILIYYTLISDDFFNTRSSNLWFFVIVPMLVILSYRWLREWRDMPWTGKKRLKVAVDMDGVLVEQVIPVLQKINSELNLNLSKPMITDWEYAFAKTNIKEEIVKAERDENFIRQMPAMDGAISAVQLISNKCDLIIATSRESISDNWSKCWLQDKNISYKEFINTYRTGKMLSEADVLIDDYVGNIDKFVRSGNGNRQAILFSQPWNHDISKIAEYINNGRVKVAHSWSTVLAILGYDEDQETKDKGDSVAEPKHELASEDLPRKYLALEALSSFVASFLFLRGYIISFSDAHNYFSVFTRWGNLSLALIFLVLTFFYFVSAYKRRLVGLGVKARAFLLSSSSTITLASIVLTWLDGIKPLDPSSNLFKIFFAGGSLFFFLYAFHIVWSIFGYSEIYKPKPKL